MKYTPDRNWGDVPDDPDVRVHSRLLHRAGEGAPAKKRHHFISVTYMEGFTADDGRILAYRLAKPDQPHPKRPEEAAFSNHYYSQIREDGTRDDNGFEDLWGAIETVWPETMRAVHTGRVSPAVSFNLLGMVAISHVRVPAARQRHELLLAAKLRAQVVGAEKIGLLPEELKRYAGQLDTVPVGINPQQSILSMKEDFLALGELCFKLGFEVLHNQTDLPFITSDNPVCLYDPSIPPGLRRPYEYEGQVELLFPLDRKTMLRGSNRLGPTNQVVRHGKLTDIDRVRKYNATVARFAYAEVLARDRSSQDAIVRHAGKCPTIEMEISGGPGDTKIVWRHCFGPRPNLSPFIDTPEKAARLEAQMAARSGEPPRLSQIGDTQAQG